MQNITSLITWLRILIKDNPNDRNIKRHATGLLSSLSKLEKLQDINPQDYD